MGIAVTDATLNGEPVTLRVKDGVIAELGDSVEVASEDEVIDGSGRGDRRLGDGARARARERAYPRGDDALSRLRGRPAADGLARGAHLAGGGAPGARARLLGDAACVRRDDPHRHGGVLGHVLASRGGGEGGRGRRPAGGRRDAAHRRPGSGEGAGGCGRGARPGARVHLGPGAGRVRAARALHGGAGLARVGGRAGRRARGDGPDPSLRDPEGGRGLRCPARRAAGVPPGPGRPAGAGDDPRSWRLARQRRAGSDRRAGGDGGDQPRGEPEACGRGCVPLSGCARAGGRDGDRDGWARLEQLAGSLLRSEDVRAAPEERGVRRRSGGRRRDAQARHGGHVGAPSIAVAAGGGSCGLPPGARRPARAGDGRAGCRARLCGLGRGRGYDGGGGTRPDDAGASWRAPTRR